MAEVGLVASVVQLAGFGLKLSISLYAFAESVSSADKDIKHIAKDVSLTSAVLKELGDNLKDDKQAGIASDNAIKTADEVVHECTEVFREIDIALEKGTGQGTAKRSLGRLKWPFLQPKMELLRSNLERLKSTLILMLHVLTYATKTKQHTVKASQAEFERRQIQSLIMANRRAVAGFERLSLTSRAPSEEVTDEVSQSSNPVFSNSRTLGKTQVDSVANDDSTISLMTRPNIMPLPPGRVEHPSKETTNPAISATPHSHAATSPPGHIQMMSSMHVSALFEWLQKAGAIVEDTWSAQTLLTATSMPPAATDLPTKQQAPVENANSAFDPNVGPTKMDFSSLENQDVLDNFDFDSFLKENDEIKTFDPKLSFQPDTPETISTSETQGTTSTPNAKMPPVPEKKGSPSGTSDKHSIHVDLTQAFDTDRISSNVHPQNELSNENNFEIEKHPAQKSSQPSTESTPRLSAAHLQQHQDGMKAAQEADQKRANIAGTSDPISAQAQYADGSPPESSSHCVPISQEAPHLTHERFQLPSQKKLKNDLSSDVTEKASGLESRLQRSKELRLEAEEEAKKIYEERLEALGKFEDEVRNVLVLQEEAKKKEEAEEALHVRMRATLDKAGFPAESVAGLVKGKQERFNREEKTVEQIYFELNALKEGRMDRHGYDGPSGEIALDRPTWIKVHRNHMEPDTLDLYDLPWEWDKQDPAYMVIKRWLPVTDQEILFEHTRQLREHRAWVEERHPTRTYIRTSQSPGPHWSNLVRISGIDDETERMSLSHTSDEEGMNLPPPAKTSKEIENIRRLEEIVTPSKNDHARETGQDLDKQDQQLRHDLQSTNMDHQTVMERARFDEEKAKGKTEREGKLRTFDGDALFGCPQPNTENTDDPFKVPASSITETSPKVVKHNQSDDIIKPDNNTAGPVIEDASEKSPTKTPANIQNDDAERFRERMTETLKKLGYPTGGGGVRAAYDTGISVPKPPPPPKRSKQAPKEASLPPTQPGKDEPAKKESLFSMDTDLADMEGIILYDSPLANTTHQRPASYRQPSPDSGSWDAPDSWAVKKTGDLETPDVLDPTEEEATQGRQEDGNDGIPDEVDELLGRWTTL